MRPRGLAVGTAGRAYSLNPLTTLPFPAGNPLPEPPRCRAGQPRRLFLLAVVSWGLLPVGSPEVRRTYTGSRGSQDEVRVADDLWTLTWDRGASPSVVGDDLHCGGQQDL